MKSFCQQLLIMRRLDDISNCLYRVAKKSGNIEEEDKGPALKGKLSAQKIRVTSRKGLLITSWFCCLEDWPGL